MNPLKKHPHLFANGKFSVWHDERSWEITGYSVMSRLELTIEEPFNRANIECGYCTLIARPISDMSKAEIKKHDSIKQELLSMNNDTYMGETMLYLLSIGVYPFDQSHFQDGTVIDITQLEEAV